MMKKMMNMLMELGEDVIYTVAKENVIHVDLNDFEGFDSDWNEIYRKYNNPEKVETLVKWIKENSYAVDDGFYKTYYFHGFAVVLGYTSYDI